MESFIAKALNKVFEDWIDQAIDFVMTIIAMLGGAGLKVLEMKIVNDGIIYTQTIAFSLLTVKALYEILFNYILRQNGDSEADLASAFINTVKSVAVISTVPWIVKYTYKIGTQMAVDVANLTGGGFGGIGKDKSLKGVIGDLAKLNSLYLFVWIALLVAIVMFIIVIIQASIRGAELAWNAVTGSLMAVGLMNSSSEMFSNWWRQLVAISLAQASQIFLIKLAFECLQSAAGGKSQAWLALFALIGVLWVTITSPTSIKEYVHSTGVRKVGTGAAQQAGSMAFMRRMMGK